MPRFRAVLFDFDGTLVDSYAAITASVNHVLEHYGRPTLAEAQVRGLVGYGIENLMANILPDIDATAAARLYREHHPTVMKSHTKLMPGVSAGLATLSGAGIKLGVCSNKLSEFTRALLGMFRIDHYFDAVYGPDIAGATKPDPAMVLKALEQLGVPREEALYVGDMEVDIETGRRAGVETWVMPTGSNDEATLRAAHASRLFPGINELIAEVMSARPRIDPKGSVP
jgi:phosphoglycolate phosphatase